MASLAVRRPSDSRRPAASGTHAPTYETLLRRRNLFRGISLAMLALVIAIAVADELAAVRKDRSFTVGSAPRLVVRDGVGGGLRGGVAVRAGGEGTLRVEGKVHGAWRVDYRLEQRGDEVVVAVEPRSFLGWLSVLGPARFSITAPPATRLDVESRSAPIDVEGITGGGTVSTSHGSIRLAGAGGELSATTVDGSIAADGLTGSARLRGTNGSIAVSRGRAVFDLETVNGSILLDADLASPGRHRAATVNGSVKVRLHEAADLRIDARATNGAIATPSSLVPAERSPHGLVGTVGAGRGALELRTTNGSIAIE